MSDRPSVRITAFLLAFLVANCLAQYYEPPGSNYNGAFSDPIRRALGLFYYSNFLLAKNVNRHKNLGTGKHIE